RSLSAPLFPYTTLFRSTEIPAVGPIMARPVKEPLFDRIYIPPTLPQEAPPPIERQGRPAVYSTKMMLPSMASGNLQIHLPYGSEDRKSTRLNSSHVSIS